MDRNADVADTRIYLYLEISLENHVIQFSFRVSNQGAGFLLATSAS